MRRRCRSAGGRRRALSHLDAEYVFCGIGLPMSSEMGAAIDRQIDAICDGLEPWATGSVYFNFADRPTNPESIFAPETLDRLREVKRRYDPDGLISGNHNIPA